MNESDLQIQGVVFPTQSIRNCSQILSIQNVSYHTDANGDIVNLSTKPDKYTTTIACKDLNIPTFAGLKISSKILVSCIVRISQISEIKNSDQGRYINVAKTPRQNNTILVSECLDHNQKEFSVTRIDKKKIFLAKSKDLTSGKKVMVCYQPILPMVLKSINYSVQEWQIDSSKWNIELEEI